MLTRRDFIKYAGVAGAIGSVSAPDITQGGKKLPRRPNIIVLLADDLGYGDLSCYGHPSIETPALDRMAAEGQRWTDFYAGASVCSPSRGALMTGKLPVRSGLYGVKNDVFWPDAKGGIPQKTQTVAQALKEAGYTTAMLGKWHLGDRPDALPTRHGFDWWLGTPYSNDMDWLAQPEFQRLMIKQGHEGLAPEERKTLERLSVDYIAQRDAPNRRWANWNVPLIQSVELPVGYRDNVIERPVNQGILTKRYTDEAVAFIEAHASSEKPFFLYLAFNMPHRPTFASTQFKGKSPRGLYGDAVEEIDWSAARIRQTLERVGFASNTLLVFSSDNGAEGEPYGGSSGPLKGHKGQIFEGGLRVPGIFWWPGRIKPATVHGIGSLMDVYATALSLAGVKEREETLDSIDLHSALKGGPSPRECLLYYSVSGQLLGYRKGPWKVTWSENGREPAKEIKLVNLSQDVSESMDQSADQPGLAAMLAEEAKSIDKKIVRPPPAFDQ